MSHPYVYKLTHKTTGQFYFGYRCANKLDPEQDILMYQSSSRIVHNIGFDNFDADIIALFFDKSDAYDFEQRLIFEHRIDPLILNKSVFVDGQRFMNHGHTEHTRAKMSRTRKGVAKSAEMVDKMKTTKTGKSKQSGRCAETDPVAITNIKKRIQNFIFTTLRELSKHINHLSQSGMSNVKISKHLNISQTAVAKYKKMFD